MNLYFINNTVLPRSINLTVDEDINLIIEMLDAFHLHTEEQDCYPSYIEIDHDLQTELLLLNRVQTRRARVEWNKQTKPVYNSQ